jgi:uncharacterized protein
MLIRVRVTPNAKEPRVTKVGEDSFEARVDEKAMDGRANKRLVEMMADHFHVPKSRVRLVRGATSRDKVLDVAT